MNLRKSCFAYRHFWDFEEPEVIGDGANNDSNFVFTSLLLHITYQPSQRHWWPVALAHEKTLHDDLVELGIGTTGQETVQLDEEPQVDIIGLRGSPVDFTVFLMRNIHTLEIRRQMFLLLLTKFLPAKNSLEIKFFQHAVFSSRKISVRPSAQCSSLKTWGVSIAKNLALVSKN